MLPSYLYISIFTLTLVASQQQDAASDGGAAATPARPREDIPPPRLRPRPSAGFSSFLTGLLGSVTKTASVDDCPGRCVHSLASLMCDEVRKDVQCPQANMRCCVERGGGMPPPPSASKKDDDVSLNSVENEDINDDGDDEVALNDKGEIVLGSSENTQEVHSVGQNSLEARH